MLGIVFAIVAALCWGASQVFARLGLQYIKPATATFISVASSLTAIGLLSVIMDFDAIVSLSLTAVLWFGLIGVINFGIGRQFNFLAIKYIGVTRATPIAASASLFAMILAVAFTGERVNVLIIIGTVCISAGLSLLFPANEYKMNTRRKAIVGSVFAIGAALAWGTAAVLIRQGVASLASPLAGAAVSLLSGTMILGPIALRSLEIPLRQRGKSVGLVVMSGVTAGLAFTAHFFGLNVGTVVTVTPIAYAYPLFALLLSYLFLGELERITLRVVSGTIIVAAGVTLITIGRMV